MSLHDQKGFTLVEMLIALTLLSFGLLGLAGMQAVGVNQNVYANRYAAAIALAQEVTEDILSWQASDARLTSVVNQTYYLNGPNVAGNSVSVQGAGTFNATYTILLNPTINGSTVTGLAQVTVTVTGPGRTVTRTFYKRTT